MTKDQLDRMLSRASKSVQRLNRDLARVIPYPEEHPKKAIKRIRQSRDAPNKLEQEWLNKLRSLFPDYTFRYGAKRYKLANGLWYKPDITCGHFDVPGLEGFPMESQDKETAWEVKGPKSWRGGFENLKMAAHQWPEVRWILVWKIEGQWHEQLIVA